jgi:HlyD family secretion protein
MGNKEDFDASGNFEANEVIVSSEIAGRITSFTAEEGQQVVRGTQLVSIDAENLILQRQQVEASIRALHEKTIDVNPQVKLLNDQLAVQQSQLENLLHEQKRTENLVKQDAATGKQLDDLNAQVDVVKKQLAVTRQQINVQKSAAKTQNRSVLSEAAPLQKRVEQIEDQISRSEVRAPESGTILTKYAEAGEITSPGKALFKMADLSALSLRAYISGSQLSEIKPGQQVRVFVDKGKDTYKEFPGIISWISDKSEFTPKTVQTKDERANLVYAVRIRVKNDGFLKIGMYGEVRF